MMQVVTRRVLVVGKGTHRKRVSQTHVLYRVGTKGTADARGHFTGHLRVTYTAAKPVQAQVIVTIHKGHLTATRTFRVTILPPARHKSPRAG
jgi:hypothetical protein